MLASTMPFTTMRSLGLSVFHAAVTKAGMANGQRILLFIAEVIPSEVD
jgi:hypothetical protein